MKYDSNLLGKEIEIIKAKLLTFLAISGGGFIYIFKSEYYLIKLFATMLFIVSSYGIVTNIIKLGMLEGFIKKVKGEEDVI